MPRSRRLSRRQFLIGVAAALGGSAVGMPHGSAAPPAVGGLETELTPAAFLPFVARSAVGPPYLGTVVHTHCEDATHWSGQSDYWNYVNQEAVNDMVAQGLMSLTGTGSVASAWRALMPAYQPGEKVAIKVNLNNTRDCANVSPKIDALVQPINAVAAGLLEIGVASEDIYVYDAVRAVPQRLAGGDLYGVRFFDGRDEKNWNLTDPCRDEAGFTYVPETRIEFGHPDGDVMPEVHVTDVVMNATYLVNMPIMKGSHGYAGVTLGFKNHFGSIDWCKSLHDYVNVVGQPPLYRNDYSPLVDLMRSPLLGGKTVVTIGDGLFAARDFQAPPVPWITFGAKVPNSLFFAKDPVAIDCVMHDFLAAEPDTAVVPGSINYLRLAREASLGVFEEGNPWQQPYGSGYQSIRYLRVEL